MSYIAVQKGVSFETRIEEELQKFRIEYHKHYKVRGLGKKWCIDFFLPKSLVLIECKNVREKNIIRELKMDCVKFLDINNITTKYNFMLVFPKYEKGMHAFSQFCKMYYIKLANPENMIQALKTNIEDQNGLFDLSQEQKSERKRTKMILDLLKRKDGLNSSEISAKTGFDVGKCYASLRQLERARFIIGIHKKHQDKKYYIKTVDLMSY